MSDREREYRLKLAKAMQERSAALHECAKAKGELISLQSVGNSLRANISTIQEENFDLKAQLALIEAEKSYEIRSIKSEKDKELLQLKSEIEFLTQSMATSRKPLTPQVSSMSSKVNSDISHTTKHKDITTAWPEVTPVKKNAANINTSKKRKLNEVSSSPHEAITRPVPTLRGASERCPSDKNLLLLKALLAETSLDTYNVLGAAFYINNISGKRTSGSELSDGSGVYGTPGAGLQRSYSISATPFAASRRSGTLSTGTFTRYAPDILDIESSTPNSLYHTLGLLLNGDSSYVSILLVLYQYLSYRPINSFLVQSTLNLIYTVLCLQYEDYLVALSRYKPESILCDSGKINVEKSLERLGIYDVASKDNIAKEKVSKWLCTMHNISYPIISSLDGDEFKLDNSNIDEEEQCIYQLISSLTAIIQEVPFHLISPTLHCLKLLAQYSNKNHMNHFKSLLNCGVFLKVFNKDEFQSVAVSVKVYLETQCIAIEVITCLLQSPSLLEVAASYFPVGSVSKSSPAVVDGDNIGQSSINVSLLSLICSVFESSFRFEVVNCGERFLGLQVCIKAVRLLSDIISVHLEKGTNILLFGTTTIHDFSTTSGYVESKLPMVIPRLVTMLYQELELMLSITSDLVENEQFQRLVLMREALSLLSLFTGHINVRETLLASGTLPLLLSVTRRLVDLEEILSSDIDKSGVYKELAISAENLLFYLMDESIML